MPEADRIVVTVGGDFCPVGRPEAGIRQGTLRPEEVVGAVSPLFAGSDLGVVNLECPLTARGTAISKSGTNMRAHPEAVRLLTHLGGGLVTLANNHIRDYGDPGVRDTLETCAANGLLTVGAGLNLAQAQQPLYFSARGRRLAVVCVAEREFADATPQRAGANPLDLIDLMRDLRAAKAQADHVLLIIHGGLELSHYPSPRSVKLLRFLAEQGVTAVLRHHAHVVQGWENWQGVPVFYGLGNLLFDGSFPEDPGWYWGLAVTLEIAADNTCSIRLHPVSNCEQKPILAPLEGERQARALSELARFSEILRDPVALAQAWDRTLDRWRDFYLGWLVFRSAFLRRVFGRLALMRFVRPAPLNSRVWKNFLLCDAHREAVSEILRRETRD